MITKVNFIKREYYKGKNGTFTNGTEDGQEFLSIINDSISDINIASDLYFNTSPRRLTFDLKDVGNWVNDYIMQNTELRNNFIPYIVKAYDENDILVYVGLIRSGVSYEKKSNLYSFDTIDFLGLISEVGNYKFNAWNLDLTNYRELLKHIFYYVNWFIFGTGEDKEDYEAWKVLAVNNTVITDFVYFLSGNASKEGIGFDFDLNYVPKNYIGAQNQEVNMSFEFKNWMNGVTQGDVNTLYTKTLSYIAGKNLKNFNYAPNPIINNVNWIGESGVTCRFYDRSRFGFRLNPNNGILYYWYVVGFAFIVDNTWTTTGISLGLYKIDNYTIELESEELLNYADPYFYTADINKWFDDEVRDIGIDYGNADTDTQIAGEFTYNLNTISDTIIKGWYYSSYYGTQKGYANLQASNFTKGIIVDAIIKGAEINWKKEQDNTISTYLKNITYLNNAGYYITDDGVLTVRNKTDLTNTTKQMSFSNVTVFKQKKIKVGKIDNDVLNALNYGSIENIINNYYNAYFDSFNTETQIEYIDYSRSEIYSLLDTFELDNTEYVIMSVKKITEGYYPVYQLKCWGKEQLISGCVLKDLQGNVLTDLLGNNITNLLG